MSDSEARGGDLPQGWTRLSLQVPRDLAAIFRAEARGWGGVKVLGTAAIGLILAMREEHRNALCRWIAHESWDRPESITPEDVLRMLRLKVLDEGESGDDMRWFVDRILDPEITPPPGEKASDKPRRRKGA